MESRCSQSSPSACAAADDLHPISKQRSFDATRGAGEAVVKAKSAEARSLINALIPGLERRDLSATSSQRLWTSGQRRRDERETRNC